MNNIDETHEFKPFASGQQKRLIIFQKKTQIIPDLPPSVSSYSPALYVALISLCFPSFFFVSGVTFKVTATRAQQPAVISPPAAVRPDISRIDWGKPIPSPCLITEGKMKRS